MDACKECGGTLEDAIFQAEDAFEKISKGTGDGNSKKNTEKSAFSLFNEQQCVCIFTVKYHKGNSTVIGVDYVSDKCLSE